MGSRSLACADQPVNPFAGGSAMRLLMRERVPLRGVGRFTSLAAYGVVAFSSTFGCGDDREYQENGGKGGAAGAAGSVGAGSSGKAGSAGRGGASGSSGSAGIGNAGDAGADSGSGGSGSGSAGAAGAGAASAGEGGVPPEVSGAGGTPDGDAGSSAAANGGEAGSGPAVCGNGEVEGDEVCDEGEDNALELLACAPDCSRIIVAKYIVISDSREDENLGSNPVAAADSLCPAGYKAMFPYGTTRRATTSPFENKNAIDWVLQPYTYYVNTYENLIWITRSVPLLGVDDGEFHDLVSPISSVVDCFVTNLNVDGTTLQTNNCNGWSTSNGTASRQCGVPIFTTHEFIAADLDPVTCSGNGYISFYCVEQ
jgi:hypothetical protein